MESNHSKRIKIDGCQLANKKAQELRVFNEVESRRELARMVILHDYPFNMVEHVGFRRFVASLQPRFHMISRNTLTNDIMKIYKDEKAKYYKLLDKLKCRFAITIDMYTSNNKKKDFMAISAHFVDDFWVLQNCTLRFMYVDAPHTAEALSEDLIEALMEWNIDRKLSTITTVGNCTTNDVVLDLLVEELPKKDMLLDGKVLHMRSYAHILNLIVEDGLGVVTGAIERIRESVVYWTASPARVQKFKTCARVLCNINITKELALDCRTRWDSTYLMLETAIMYKDVFSKVQLREEHYRNLPTDEDWVNATEICGKLKFLYQATERFLGFSGTQYPTSNFYFPMICNIKLKLNEWVKSPNSMIQDMAEKMLDTCFMDLSKELDKFLRKNGRKKQSYHL